MNFQLVFKFELLKNVEFSSKCVAAQNHSRAGSSGQCGVQGGL